MLDKRVQQARYEKYVFELAKAYKGYRLYFPAFIDFRGRISRSGMLHFHEL
jgi:DNA-directed RNA polymerase